MKTKREALEEQRNAILSQIEDLKARAEGLRVIAEETPAEELSGEYEPGMFSELNDWLERTGRKDTEAAQGLY